MWLMHLEKRGFVIFLQWPTFWDFNDTRLLNYIPSAQYPNLLSAIILMKCADTVPDERMHESVTTSSKRKKQSKYFWTLRSL